MVQMQIAEMAAKGKPSVDQKEPNDRKSEKMDRKPSTVSACSPDELIAPEAPGSTQVAVSITDSDRNSALREVSLEGVLTPALLDTGSSINLMTQAMWGGSPPRPAITSTEQ